MIKVLLSHLEYGNKDHNLIRPNTDVVFNYVEDYLNNGMIAP